MESKALDFSPDVFKQSFDSAPIGIAVVGSDNKWLYVNEELCSIFGVAPLEIKRRTWRDFTVDADIDADQAQIDECLKRNGPDGYCMEKRYHRKNPGEWFWASLVMSCVRDDDGNFQHFIKYVIPCSRPGAALVSWAWALKNWKPLGSVFGSGLLFIGWAFGWISSERLGVLKTIFLP